MKLLVLLVTLGSIAVLSAPLPGPLEEQFNLPSFTTKQENHGELFVEKCSRAWPENHILCTNYAKLLDKSLFLSFFFILISSPALKTREH
ncbi:unnamed protein product [Nippostrongylus brasiliensis]|uniref:Secreted protein n=1 Tax=Nippostrongylus brasiliensis TaxID=27835 RepID=A0A0N4XSE9_NIPBR|nr:unnamed protein product [Nippostrongylus brasiliensis]